MIEREEKLWKTGTVRFPSQNGSSSHEHYAYVRTDGEIYQVRVEKALSSPCDTAVGDYMEEIAEASSGLVGAKLNLSDGGDDYSSEMVLTGWREATNSEITAIKRHHFER